MGRLQDKIAIVTGATSGIGRGCALAMAEAGARLIVTGRNVERGHITVDMIDELGGESVFVQQDVTREADWHEVINTNQLSLCRAASIEFLFGGAGDDGTPGRYLKRGCAFTDRQRGRHHRRSAGSRGR